MKRNITVLMTTFALVLIAGVAAAQVGDFGFTSQPEPEEKASVDLIEDEQPSEEPAAEDKDDDVGFGFGTDTDTSKDEPVDAEPKDEPVKDEPKDDEPKVEDDDEKPESDEADVVAPDLKITSPADGAKVDDEYIVFSGVTESGATVHAGDWAADVHGTTASGPSNCASTRAPTKQHSPPATKQATPRPLRSP